MATLIINGNNLTIEDVGRVADGFSNIELAPEAIKRIEKSREVIEALLKEGKVVYGVNTGFGKFSDVRIPEDKIELLQQNLVMSHAAGVGKFLPEKLVRAILLLKANTIAKGYSGCRLEIVERLLDMLRLGIYPVIPEKGSVGASGDLAPLAHLALVMIGLGEAIYKGEKISGQEALIRAGLEPIKLEAKEGLALLNGTQVTAALACLAYLRLANLVRAADIIGAMSTEALLGTPVAFDERIQKAGGLEGQIKVGRNLTKLLQDSQIVASHKNCKKIQDAYSLRCMPQVHGTVREALSFVHSILEKEINAATDNPLVFAEEKQVLSGGNFHGQPLALACDVLAIASAQLANISERRLEYLLDPNTSDMAGFLTEEGGLNSGFMIAQVTAASLVSENKVLCHPASVDSIPTSANKEDFVSMSTLSARKALEVVENSEFVLAIELLCACQGLDFKEPLRPGLAVDWAWKRFRTHVPHWDSDRVMYPDIQKARDFIVKGELVAGVEKIIGEL